MFLTLVTPLIAMWVLLNNVVTELALRASVWSTITLPMLIPMRPAIIPMAQCLPTNNSLTKGAFGRLSDQLGGGLAGLAMELVTGVVAAAVVIAMVLSLSDHGPKWLKKIPQAPASIILGIGVIVLLKVIVPLFNNVC